MITLVGYLLLILIATAVIWKGSGMLEHSAAHLSKHYGLPVAVHGAVVIAIGSSFPEISSVVISTLLHGEFNLGVGAIVGSAIFNILIIPSLASLASEDLESTRDIVHKDAQFYIISILILFITFALGATYVSGGTNEEALVTRPLVILPMLTYGVYIFLQYQDTQDHDSLDTPDINVARTWGKLLLSLAIIVIGVEALVQAALGLGDLFGTPSFLWGLTVIAAGTSLPDALVSVRAAQNNEAVTSLTNVLGSNTFDLLVAIPLGVLIAGTATVNYLAAIPMMGFLAFATLVFIVFTRTDLELTNRESYTMLALYVLFIGWMALETFDILNLVKGV